MNSSVRSSISRHTARVAIPVNPNSNRQNQQLQVKVEKPSRTGKVGHAGPQSYEGCRTRHPIATSQRQTV